MDNQINDPQLQKNICQLEHVFADCSSPKQIYTKIMELGRQLPLLSATYRTEEYLVKGCQSQMFLKTFERENKLFFEAYSDAFISAGLAFVMIQLLQGLCPKTILQHQPTIFEKLHITTSLSPSRSNGLFHIHLRIKQDALYFLTQKQNF